MTVWSVIVCRNGQPLTGQVPCDDWYAATSLAEVAVLIAGGPVSVAQAVVRQQQIDASAVGLFSEEAA